MIEGGNVYLCDKKEKNGKYFLSLLENKEIKASSEDLEWCKVEICSKIILWNGDGEAVLEFPPEKSKKMPTGIDLYRILGYNEGVDILNTNHPFSEGRCKKCLHELGERTDELLNLEWKPKNVIVSVDRRAKKDKNDYSRIFKQIVIYHKKFINLFTEKEKSVFITKPVLIKGEESDYIELIPINIILQSGHKGADYYKGIVKSWKCSECGYFEYNLYAHEYKRRYAFVDPKMIRKNPTIFFLNHGMHTLLIVRNDRWAELFKYKKEIKGIATNSAVVLEEKYVEYPELEEPEKFEW